MFTTTQAQFDKAMNAGASTITISAVRQNAEPITVGATGTTRVSVTNLAQVRALAGATVYAYREARVRALAGSVAHGFGGAVLLAGPGSTAYCHEATVKAVDTSKVGEAAARIFHSYV